MVVEVGRVEHGEDTVERIRVVEGRKNKKGVEREREKRERRGEDKDGDVDAGKTSRVARYHRRVPSRGILFSRAAEARNCRSAKEIVEKKFLLLSLAT